MNIKKHFCVFCLQCFSSEDILNKHKTDCIIINGKQSIKMPKKNSFVKFENFHKQLPVPFVIYADFEAITQKIDSCQKIQINHTQKHIKNILIVVMVIKWFVVMMINIQNQ